MNSLTIKQFIQLTVQTFSLLILFALLNPVLAADIRGQGLENFKVDLSVTDASVIEVLKDIETKTDFRFMYDRKLQRLKNTYDLSYKDVSLRSVLEVLAKDANLTFKRINKIISVDVKPKTKSRIIEVDIQKITITGVVLDENGNPLPGASIMEKGTTNGTTTDFDGNFTIEVEDPNAVLVISYIGYLTKEVALRGRSNITVQLQTDAAGLDEVLVIGYRYQNTATINAKKATVQIADFLTQDNIGRLPDFAAADAARRIAGVNTIFDEDEATQVGIRGLPPIYTFATIDGLAIPSADRNTRVANFEVIPSSAIGRIEVYKSLTADLDGNSIGGVFNLKTRSAFDSKGKLIIGNVSIGDYDFDDVPRTSRDNAERNGISIRSDFTYAGKFGSSNQFGIVASGSYNRKDRDELKYPRANYSFIDDDPSRPFPNRLRVNAYDNIINRYGGFAKFEFKPNNDFYASVTGSFFRKTDNEIRYESRIDNLIFDESSLNPNGGRFTEGRNRFAHNIFEIEHEVSNFIVESFYKLNDKNKIDVRFGLANGLRGEDGPGATYRSTTTTDLSGTFNVDNRGLFYELDNPTFYLNPGNYPLNDIGGFTRIDDEDYSSLQLNYSHNMENDDQGWGFKTGYKYRNLNHFFDDDFLGLDYIGPEPLPLSQFLVDSTYEPSQAMGQPYPLFDPFAFNDFISENPGLFALPEGSQGSLFGRGILDNPSSQFDIDETINAFYGMLSYKTDKVQLFGGVRYESTQTTTSRPISVDGVFDGSQSQNENDFNNILPSFSMSMDLTADIKLRTAYSRAIGRADYGQLAPNEIVDSANEQIFRGNPNLKPRLSDNFDASFEYYYDRGSSLFSLGFFHKNVKDDIQTELIVEGENEVFTPVNIDRLTVTGVEVNFIKSKFEFLPGFLSDFGVSSNYTFIVGERILNNGQLLASIPRLPRNTINAQFFYQRQKFDARLAWNWVDETLTSVRTGQEFNNVYLDVYNQWDFNCNYRLSNKLAIFAEVRNLTNENRIFLAGPNQGLAQEVTEYGRSFWLGLNFTL
ncbi:MAG: TonB-dependent receptor [Bacteroidota bacterium]